MVCCAVLCCAVLCYAVLCRWQVVCARGHAVAGPLAVSLPASALPPFRSPLPALSLALVTHSFPRPLSLTLHRARGETTELKHAQDFGAVVQRAVASGRRGIFQSNTARAREIAAPAAYPYPHEKSLRGSHARTHTYKHTRGPVPTAPRCDLRCWTLCAL